MKRTYRAYSLASTSESLLTAHRKQQGAVVMITILVMFVIISILTLGLARILIMEERNELDSLTHSQAFMAAQAGLNFALGYTVMHTAELLPDVVIGSSDLASDITALNNQLKQTGNQGEITAIKINYLIPVEGGAVFEIASKAKSADGKIEVGVCRKVVRTGSDTSGDTSEPTKGKGGGGGKGGGKKGGGSSSGGTTITGAVGIVGGSWRDYGCSI